MSRNGRRTATRKSDTELSTPDVSMHALAEVVRTEAHEAIAPVKTKLSSTQATLEKMLLDVEGKVDAQNIRIETLQRFMEKMNTEPRRAHQAAML